MNSKKAFSLVEIIVSFFILLLVLIPTIKLNLQILETYNKISETRKNYENFRNIVNLLKAEENININIHKTFFSFQDLKKDFELFDSEIKEKNFKLDLNIEKEEVDYTFKKKKLITIIVEYENAGEKFNTKIQKIGD